MRKENLNTMRKMLAESKKQSVFVASDFVHIADKSNVNTCLTRLENEGIIHRIMRGVYYKPEHDSILQEYVSPKPDNVAHALARNFGWTIVPCGDTALNLVGLSTRIPNIWMYVSDGTYKEYRYENTTIKFKRTTNKEISKLSSKTALVVQVLKALGKENVTDVILERLKNILTNEEKKALFTEAKTVTSWIYEDIKVICEN